MDATEAAANAIVGLFVSWFATWAVLGYSPAQSIAVTALFTGLSFTRSYVLRCLFRRLT